MSDFYYASIIVVSIGAGIGKLASINQRFIDHEKQDADRFNMLYEDTKEIKQDIKTLLARGNKK